MLRQLFFFLGTLIRVRESSARAWWFSPAPFAARPCVALVILSPGELIGIAFVACRREPDRSFSRLKRARGQMPWRLMPFASDCPSTVQRDTGDAFGETLGSRGRQASLADFACAAGQRRRPLRWSFAALGRVGGHIFVRSLGYFRRSWGLFGSGVHRAAPSSR